jgi:hypothetical protein
VRSRQEILFRLRQELGNLAMLVSPPSGDGRGPARISPLPAGAEVANALRATPYAGEVAAVADSVLAHRFPLLGVTIDTGRTIDWRRDYLHGISTGTPYFRRSPYLDFSRVGDHKVVWELNRHQHLPLLAQAFLLTGRRAYLEEAFRQMDSWLAANPFLRGINWASALEVAFRALSWGWLWHLAGGEMDADLRTRFLTALYRHGRYLERNLSVFFSPNTHLLGEAVTLHALGAWFPDWPDSRRWRETGGRITAEELRRQVREDGSHFEQSVYYHVYALDFFLLHRLLAECPAAYDERLMRMAEFLHALMGPGGTLPLIGDDDGGRLFHPYGDRMRFGRATMATCAALFRRPDWLRAAEDLHAQAAWWLGPHAIEVRPAAAAPAASRMFADSGLAVMSAGDAHVVVKSGGFGEGSGGHSHSDVLSLVVRLGEREVLIDPGTFTYISDPAERDRFRGSAAHNSVRIDGRDQAIPAGPFRWRDKPSVKVADWSTAPERDYLDVTCAYAGFAHRRRILFVKPCTLVIVDTVEGPPGEHTVEQFWHLGSREEARRLSLSGVAEEVEGWRSRAFASREKAAVMRVTARGGLPAELAAVVDLSEAGEKRVVGVQGDAEACVITWGDVRLVMAP